MINNSSNTIDGVRFDSCTNTEKQLTANTADTLLEANPSRQYAAFVNNSIYDITLILGDKSKGGLGKGIVLKPYGGSYEINQNNLYVGKISAICFNTCKISCVECS